LRFALGGSREFGWPATDLKVMNRLAEGLGHEVAKSAHATNLKEAVGVLTQFWEENGFGRLSFRAGKRPIIKMRQCYDCVGWRYGFTSVSCSFKATLIRVAISDLLGFDVKVAEVECCRTGGRGCDFSVTSSAKAHPI
jgi:predicted hydrocarbon binding protein